MARPDGVSRRERGSIDSLPSGALRVRVYAGLDVITKRRHYLTEVVPAGPDAERLAEEARDRFLREIDERSHPRTNATVGFMVAAHITAARLERTTRETYDGYARKHIYPIIGHFKAESLAVEVLDSYYEELERCREHCSGGPETDHRTPGEHTCDRRCRRHVCKPLAAWTVRKIHFILTGAYKRAGRKSWVTRSPMANADPPPPPPPKPSPPSPEEIATILDEAWRRDLDFGALVWTSTTTGARRGEMCALRWRHFQPGLKRLRVEASMAQGNTDIWEKDTKSHQHRILALDAETTAILSQLKRCCEHRTRELGIDLSPEAFIFATSPDGMVGFKPRAVSQRYRRMVDKLGINTTFHKLRHYSATDLISGGVDIRTVAGRLGHSGGGTTTLKMYAAWVEEADQRASETLMTRMPTTPAPIPEPRDRPKAAPRSPYETIAALERTRIVTDDIPDGAPAPTVKELADRHAVSVGTAHRALGLLKDWGLVSRTGRGVKPVIIRSDSDDEGVALYEAPVANVTRLPSQPVETSVHVEPSAPTGGNRPLQLEIVGPAGEVLTKLVTSADPANLDELRRLFTGALRRKGHPDDSYGDFEMNVSIVGADGLLLTFVA